VLALRQALLATHHWLRPHRGPTPKGSFFSDFYVVFSPKLNLPLKQFGQNKIFNNYLMGLNPTFHFVGQFDSDQEEEKKRGEEEKE